MIRRRDLIGTLDNICYDYQVEYIESNSKQLFNTGINGGDNVEYEIEFMYLPQKIAYAQLFGSGYIHSDNDYSPKLYMDSLRPYSYVEWGTNGVQSQQINNAFNINTKYKVEYKNGYFKIDNNIICQPGIHGFGNMNFCIFGYLGEPNLKACMRLYYCKIWKDGMLTGDFIPCSLNNVGYMYDKISRQLFGNTGDDIFIIGPPVNVTYTEIEYIESSNYAFIDTEYKPNHNTNIYIDIQNVYDDATKYPRIFGCSSGSSWDSAPTFQLDFETYYYGNLLVMRGSETSWNNTGKTGDLKRHRFSMGRTVSMDNAILRDYNNASFQCTTNLTIFALNTSDGVYGIHTTQTDKNDFLRAKLYSCHFYESEQIRNMIPVRVKNDGFMYDTMNNKFYGSRGYGNFICGPKKIPKFENYVDLGLPSGLLWAKCNVGSVTEVGYGNYYKWGAIKPDAGFNDYKEITSNAYDTQSSGTLPLEKDVAYKFKNEIGGFGYYGDEYRMPTKEEFEELINNTTFSLVTVDGINCGKFSRTVNGEERYILFPCAGNHCGNGAGNVFAYYSSTAYNSDFAWGMWYNNSRLIVTWVWGSGKNDALTVRGVRR